MGKVVSQLADLAILTSDNPRSEDPQAILKQIVPGFTRPIYKIVEDREQAIQEALRSAKKGDVVLIAGKGHEDYQIFKDRKIHFDDRETARAVLNSITHKI
jgi:UDP-N-acetylmuramoyl-L-alanyl-D-glutamate--2,6-diaminopimelate ligase